MRRFKKIIGKVIPYLERAAHCTPRRLRTSMLEREWLHYGECVPFTRRFNATISKTVVEREGEREREGRNGKIGKRREVIAGQRNDGGRMD